MKFFPFKFWWSIYCILKQVWHFLKQFLYLLFCWKVLLSIHAYSAKLCLYWLFLSSLTHVSYSSTSTAGNETLKSLYQTSVYIHRTFCGRRVSLSTRKFKYSSVWSNIWGTSVMFGGQMTTLEPCVPSLTFVVVSETIHTKYNKYCLA